MHYLAVLVAILASLFFCCNMPFIVMNSHNVFFVIACIMELVVVGSAVFSFMQAGIEGVTKKAVAIALQKNKLPADAEVALRILFGNYNATIDISRGICWLRARNGEELSCVVEGIPQALEWAKENNEKKVELDE